MSRQENHEAAERALARVKARKAQQIAALKAVTEAAVQLATAIVTSPHCSMLVHRTEGGIVEVMDSAGRTFTVTVLQSFKSSDDQDDDGDDDEPADGESFDGGFGPGSYFARAMAKDD